MIATQVGRIVFMPALMRLLGPRNFGIVAQASVIIAVAQIFVHFGLAVSIVQKASLDHREAGTAFWLNVAMGLLLAALMVLSTPLLSSFFKPDELKAVLEVLSICLVLKAMTVVPSALLTRKMQFRNLGIIEVAGMFASGILGIGAAAMGAGYWAMVIQSVSLEAIYLLLIMYINGVPELAWSTTTARRLWSFSSRIMGADLVNYISGNFDKLIVAKLLGATALGLYSVAFRILQLTLAVCNQVGRVVLPTFARLQDDPERMARSFRSVTEIVSLVVCPAMTLAILIAPIAVPAVLGEAWADAVVPLQLVSAMTIPWILVSFMGPLTVAIGRADCEFYWSIVTMVSMFAVIPIGLRWGIVGVSASYLIMLTVLTPVRFAIIQRLIPVSSRKYLRAAHGGFAPGHERPGHHYGSVDDGRGSLSGDPQGRLAQRLPSPTRIRQPSPARRANVNAPTPQPSLLASNSIWLAWATCNRLSLDSHWQRASDHFITFDILVRHGAERMSVQSNGQEKATGQESPIKGFLHSAKRHDQEKLR
jgi:lipopolysaccharide exporter